MRSYQKGGAELRNDPLPPLSLYVHLPWCVHKCPYCDFNSFELRGAIDDHAYVGALLRDLDFERELVTGRTVASVFIGGGTPSLFAGEAVANLLDGIRDRIDLAEDCEITLEANPGTVEARRFDAYRKAGVNRLSIGAQSFRDPQLAALGRIHGADEIEAAVAIARNAGFENLNLDLMYALPDDTLDGALADLDRALALEPEHLSWYQLTLEPNTAFHRRPPPLPDDALVAEIERSGRRRLEDHGFRRYEISAYARPARRCRHNLNYWEFGDYVGIGAGAHGKITRPGAAIERRTRLRNPRSFMALAGTAGCVTSECIADPASVRLEFLMNALRLTDGVPQELLAERTGLTLEPLGASVTAAIERGWLERSPDRLLATPQGLEALNQLLAMMT